MKRLNDGGGKEGGRPLRWRGILRVAMLLFFLRIPASVCATERAPSWIVEETSGTVRLTQPGKPPAILRGGPRALFEGDKLTIAPGGGARVFTGRVRQWLLPEGPDAARVFAAPAPPPGSSAIARLLAAIARRQSARVEAGVVVRIPSTDPCRFIFPEEDARYFVGDRPPDAVVEVLLVLLSQPSVEVRRRAVDAPADSPSERILSLAVPKSHGAHGIGWIESSECADCFPSGFRYDLILSLEGKELATRRVEHAPEAVLDAYRKDRKELLDALAADGFTGKPDDALGYLAAEHELLAAPRD
ncbi:hypothetical protein BH09SUM1_BH09SUM1_09630 [soil metagenome]